MVISCGLAGMTTYYGTSTTCAAETGITIEAVDNYSCGPLSNNVANVDNFLNRMLSIPELYGRRPIY
jgi:hypothetical protein